MIGMDFLSFLILLIISVVVSALMHYLFKYYIVPGFTSFLSKVVFGWIGAWLGSPVLGNWFAGFQYKEVYIIPAILGSFAILIILVDLVKTCGSVMQGKEKSET